MGKRKNAHNYNSQTQKKYSILLLDICICSIIANSLTSDENTYDKCSYPGGTKRWHLKDENIKDLHFICND